MKVPAARVVFSDEDQNLIASKSIAMLKSGALTLGAETRAFEGLFASSHNAPFAVAVSSGTAAIEIILRSLDVAGRDVIIPTNTFAATAFAVLRAGGRIIFADISDETMSLSMDSIRKVITPNTAAVILVHIGGVITPEVFRFQQYCADRDIALVEDAAHAHGCSYGGTTAGSFGIAGAFSFYPTKVITSGEGGMILTADERIRDEARIYRDQGKAGFGENLHIRAGYAWRMSELHAATGLVHLAHLNEFIARRQAVALRYDEALEDVDWLDILRIPERGVNNYYKYILLLKVQVDRALLKRHLRETFAVHLAGEVYSTPLHRQPVFREFDRHELVVADRVCGSHICLPLHSDMRQDEVEWVLSSLRAAGEHLIR